MKDSLEACICSIRHGLTYSSRNDGDHGTVFDVYIDNLISTQINMGHIKSLIVLNKYLLAQFLTYILLNNV